MLNDETYLSEYLYIRILDFQLVLYIHWYSANVSYQSQLSC